MITRHCDRCGSSREVESIVLNSGKCMSCGSWATSHAERHKTGYYWFYTLSDEKPLEVIGKPSVCWYDSTNNVVQEIGSDLDLGYHPKKYKLLKRITYDEVS